MNTNGRPERNKLPENVADDISQQIQLLRKLERKLMELRYEDACEPNVTSNIARCKQAIDTTVSNLAEYGITS